MSPFYANVGFHPHFLPIFQVRPESQVPEVTSRLNDLSQMAERLRRNISKAKTLFKK